MLSILKSCFSNNKIDKSNQTKIVDGVEIKVINNEIVNKAEIEDEIEDEIDIELDDEIENQNNIVVKAEKHCSYCKDINHTISKCDKMNYELEKITQYCSLIENQNNIPETRKYLQSINNTIISRYAVKNKIRRFMYNNCFQYYVNNIEPCKNIFYKNVELIIGYLCVLPLHPEIRIKKVSQPKAPQPVHCHKNHNNGNFGVFVGTQGVGVGFML